MARAFWQGPPPVGRQLEGGGLGGWLAGAREPEGPISAQDATCLCLLCPAAPPSIHPLPTRPPAAPQRESEGEKAETRERVEEDRKPQVEAAIVRIMKVGWGAGRGVCAAGGRRGVGSSTGRLWQLGG